MKIRTQALVKLTLLLIFSGLQTCVAKANELPSFQLGPYPVATTNMAVKDGYHNLSSEDMNAFLAGKRSLFGADKYVSDILAHPQSAWLINVDVPQDKSMYGSFSGKQLPTVAYITYPSSSAIKAKSYNFPYDDSAYGRFEHMLAPDEKPVFADDNQNYPLIVYSHGMSAHGIYDINHANLLASHGYIVAVIFYGDNRLLELFGNNQHRGFLRPLLTSALIDSLLSSDWFGSHIDKDNIGISGHSFGGFTGLSLAGADIDGNIQSVKDSRVNAVVAAAPWTGRVNEDNSTYAFGPENKSLNKVTVPTIGFFGTADTITTKEAILPAMKLLSGPTYVVELVDQPHVFESGSWEDRNNWELLFFSAYLKNDANAKTQLEQGTSMRGGNIDRQLMDYQSLP